MSISLDCGHLFAGINGFGLAARCMGWNNIWHSEIDEYCNKIIKQHFPNSIPYGDIKQIDFEKMPSVNLITGGFPCQPFSSAGKRAGTEDDRYLWPEMFKVIKCKSPAWVVAENVYGIVNWNEGLVLETVLSDLENEGYEVQTYVLPAAGVNAPHRRYRVWIVAYSESGYDSGIKRKFYKENGGQDGTLLSPSRSTSNGLCSNGASANTKSLRQKLSRRAWSGRERFENGNGCSNGFWNDFPTSPPICRGDDGVPDRVDRIKSLGNAIVPQVAYQIFKAIEQYELNH